MKNVRNLLVIGFVLFFISLGIMIAVISRRSAPQTQTGSPTPTLRAGTTMPPSPVARLSLVPVTLVNTNPPHGAERIPINTDITLTFSHTVRVNDVEILSDPRIDFQVSVVPFKSNQLLLKLTKPLLPGVKYIFRTTYTPSPYSSDSFSFTTVGPTESTPRDTAPDPTIVNEADRAYLKDRPDIFLTNKVPYEAASFRITSTYTKNPPGHFYFDVTVKTGSQSQVTQALNQWLYSLGMDDSHISRLDIRYK